MTLRTIQKLCRLLSVGSIICLIGSLITSSSPLLYLGVIGTFAHGWLNLRLFRQTPIAPTVDSLSTGANR